MQRPYRAWLDRALSQTSWRAAAIAMQAAAAAGPPFFVWTTI